MGSSIQWFLESSPSLLDLFLLRFSFSCFFLFFFCPWLSNIATWINRVFFWWAMFRDRMEHPLFKVFSMRCYYVWQWRMLGMRKNVWHAWMIWKGYGEEDKKCMLDKLFLDTYWCMHVIIWLCWMKKKGKKTNNACSNV